MACAATLDSDGGREGRRKGEREKIEWAHPRLVKAQPAVSQHRRPQTHHPSLCAIIFICMSVGAVYTWDGKLGCQSSTFYLFRPLWFCTPG